MSNPNSPSTAEKTPEPLVSAEIVRTLIVAGVAAAGAAPLSDGVLGVVVPIAASAVAAALSWGLTAISRGKVWALRKGVDVDRYVDEVQSRTGSYGNGSSYR